LKKELTISRLFFNYFLFYFFWIFPLISFSQLDVHQLQEDKINKQYIIIKNSKRDSLHTITEHGYLITRRYKEIKEVKQIVNQEDKNKIFRNSIDRIQKIELKSEASYWQLLRSLKRNAQYEYVEPYYNYELLYTPNDPEAQPGDGNQTYLSNIRAYESWDIQQSDSTIIIAIIDTGVDTAHADLMANHYINLADPINGIDDDSDGYIDNNLGWDFADDDRDIFADTDAHGTQVAGISNAVTDNGSGIAGVGFKAKFLPLKIFRSGTNEFLNGFEAVLYAATIGCDIIVLSWGSPDAYSQYAQDIIDYVVEELDVVVIGAAGNTPGELDFYPASYDNVLSTGAVDANDQLPNWASYSHYLDIVAQGQDVYTTSNENQYGFVVGSSFAVPQIAGAAALLRNEYPSWSAKQIMEQLRVTAEDIYDIEGNEQFIDKLGKGRLNIINALTDSISISVRMNSYQYTNGLGSYVFNNDTILLGIDLKNYLHEVSDLNITLTTDNPHVQITEKNINFGFMDEYDSVSISETPFQLYFNNELGYHEKIKLRLGFEGLNYNDYQYFQFYSNDYFFDFDNRKLSLTISDDGRLGYLNEFLLDGIGLKYQEQHMIKSMGLIFSTDSIRVLDNTIDDIKNYITSNDFSAVNKIKLYKNSIADFDARSAFVDNTEMIKKMNIQVEQKILSDINKPFIIFEYRVINTNDTTLSNLNIGHFVDWDINEFTENRAGWSSSDSLGFVFSPAGNIYAGIAVIGQKDLSYYALDLENKDGNVPDVDSLFTDGLKHKFISSGLEKLSAGSEGSGNDVAHVIGVHSTELLAGEARKFAFVVVISDDLPHLVDNLSEAKIFYKEYLDNPPVEEVYEICTNDDVEINPSSGSLFDFFSDPYQQNFIKTDTALILYNLEHDTTIYMTNRDNNFSGDIKAVNVKIREPIAGFSTSIDTLLINQNTEGTIEFIDQSFDASIWEWDFGNGYGSTIQNPQSNYNSSGIFNIRLRVQNVVGCIDSASTQILVGYKNSIPDVNNQILCINDPAILSAGNTDSILVYDDFNKSRLLFSGDIFVSDPLQNDTVFWVSNVKGSYESDLKEVEVRISNPDVSFEYYIDTTDLSSISKLIFDHSGDSLITRSWFINHASLGNDNKIGYDYNNVDKFTVTLLVEDSIGCQDSTSMAFNPVETPEPKFDSQIVCINQRALIRSKKNRLLAVYSDGDMKDRIFKGKLFMTPPLTESIVYYITSLDSLLESRPIPVTIEVSKVSAQINIDPDTLNILESNQVEFSAADGMIRYYWEFERNGTDTLPVVQRNYYDVGTYDIFLSMTDSIGCIHEETRKLIVIMITGIDDELPNVILYPNPSENIVNIQLPAEKGKRIIFQLLDENGRMIESKYQLMNNELIQLNTEGYSSGLYMVKIIIDQNKEITLRLMID